MELESSAHEPSRDGEPKKEVVLPGEILDREMTLKTASAFYGGIDALKDQGVEKAFGRKVLEPHRSVIKALLQLEVFDDTDGVIKKNVTAQLLTSRVKAFADTESDYKATKWIDEAVNAGLIKWRPSDDDGRVKLFELTDLTKDALKKLERLYPMMLDEARALHNQNCSAGKLPEEYRFDFREAGKAAIRKARELLGRFLEMQLLGFRQ